MKRKLITMVGIAAVFGAISIFAADFWLKSAANARVVTVSDPAAALPAEPKIEFGTIVVATQPLRFGASLDRATLGEIPWPRDNMPAGSYARIDELLADGARVVLSPIEINEPILGNKLSGPDGRATLSNLLAPGMRAVAIKTDEVAGVGGFIAPGDRVDIVLTRDAGRIQEVARAADGATGSTLTSEVVLSNVKVLTVGQGADERQTSPQVVNSVTVEVTVDGAQKIALARTVGQLSLSLRSAAEAGMASGGLTTISAFGGSVTEGLSKAVDTIVEVASGSNERQYRTILVTRGMEPQQSYRVVSPRD